MYEGIVQILINLKGVVSMISSILLTLLLRLSKMVNSPMGVLLQIPLWG